MPENYQNILVDRDENVGIVTLNRPNALNALNFQLVGEVAEALMEFERDESIRCIVITGAGEKAFAAGADIKEMSDKSPIDMMMGGFEAWEGIKRVRVLVNGGDKSYDAGFIDRPDVSGRWPWYPKTTRAGFVAVLPKRPKGVRRETDVQLEFTDGAGRVTRSLDITTTWD